MHFVANLFPVMGVQNLSKSVKICQSYLQKIAATFFMPHSVSQSNASPLTGTVQEAQLVLG